MESNNNYIETNTVTEARATNPDRMNSSPIIEEEIPDKKEKNHDKN